MKNVLEYKADPRSEFFIYIGPKFEAYWNKKFRDMDTLAHIEKYLLEDCIGRERIYCEVIP